MRTGSGLAAIVFGRLHSVLGVAALATTLTCLGAAPLAAQQPVSMDQAIEQVGGELASMSHL